MQWLNPFRAVPNIMRAEEIIEFAHRRSTRISTKSSLRLPRTERARIREIGRLQEFTRQVCTKLKEPVEGFPSLDHIHPFYYEMADLLVGIDDLKRALGAVYNCIPPIEEISRKHIEAMKLAADYRQLKRTRSSAKGRISSIVRGTDSNLDVLIKSRAVLSRLPSISPEMPTVVVSGYPNVGKSTLVKSVSSAEPEVAYYPFTTRDVIVGHLEVDNKIVQFVDTPGLLDRPMANRNEIERKAIAALKYLAHVIVFMMDPSGTCGWELSEQLQLYSEIRRTFPLTPIVVVFNKVDITPEEQLNRAVALMPDALKTVASDGVGIREVLNAALSRLGFERSNFPSREGH
ncbi:MAG: GTPase [Candidatus Thorarchaeota archaeon]